MDWNYAFELIIALLATKITERSITKPCLNFIFHAPLIVLWQKQWHCLWHISLSPKYFSLTSIPHPKSEFQKQQNSFIGSILKMVKDAH